MRTPPRLTARRALGAAAFIAGGVQYVVMEAIAASAWSRPPYSYLANYISDLGVSVPQTYEGRVVNSPLAWVMNTGFVLEGVLFAVGALLLADLFRGRAKAAFVTFSLLHGIGIVLVGFFDETSTIGPLHVGGAYSSIIFGNLAALVVGLSWKRLSLPRWFGIVSVALPVLGLLSELVLISGITSQSLDGLWERGGVYSITVWEILFGAVVITSRRAPYDRASRTA